MSLESNGGMILTGKNRRTLRKASPSMKFLLITQLQYLRKKQVYRFHTDNTGKNVITKSENIRYKNQEESIKSLCHFLYVT
jgi:hypothetical protein